MHNQVFAGCIAGGNDGAVRIQPSLRGLLGYGERFPGTEVSGYCHVVPTGRPFGQERLSYCVFSFALRLQKTRTPVKTRTAVKTRIPAEMQDFRRRRRDETTLVKLP